MFASTKRTTRICWNWNAVSVICFVRVVLPGRWAESISYLFCFRSPILLRSLQMHNTQCTAATLCVVNVHINTTNVHFYGFDRLIFQFGITEKPALNWILGTMKFDIVVKKFFVEDEIFIIYISTAYMRIYLWEINRRPDIQIPQLLTDDVSPLNPLIFLQTSNKTSKSFYLLFCFSNFYFFNIFIFIWNIFKHLCECTTSSTVQYFMDSDVH